MTCPLFNPCLNSNSIVGLGLVSANTTWAGSSIGMESNLNISFFHLGIIFVSRDEIIMRRREDSARVQLLQVVMENSHTKAIITVEKRKDLQIETSNLLRAFQYACDRQRKCI